MRGVSAPGGCLLIRGWCLVLGVSGSGGCLVPGGVRSWGMSGPRGSTPGGGCLFLVGGCIPACTEADLPCEQNDRQV